MQRSSPGYFSQEIIPDSCPEHLCTLKPPFQIRMFCTLTFTGSGIGLIILTFLPSSNQMLSTIVTIASLSFLGFNAGGFPKSAVLISQRKPASVMGFVQAALTFGLLAGSFIVPGLTPGRTFAEYSNLFRLFGGLLIAANIFFVIFCRAEAEDFAYHTEVSVLANRVAPVYQVEIPPIEMKEHEREITISFK